MLIKAIEKLEHEGFNIFRHGPGCVGTPAKRSIFWMRSYREGRAKSWRKDSDISKIKL